MLKSRTTHIAARLFIGVAGLTCLAAAVMGGEVYKSVDAQGHVVYSDRASSSTARKSEVTVVEGDPAEAARAARQTQLLNAQLNQTQKLQADADHTKAVQDHDRQVKCENARHQYLVMKDANLLYRIDAQGNRQFYSDADADSRREQARLAMTAACGS